MGFRYPFTDYLDGISLAANPDKKDWYIVTGVTASYRFGTGSDKDNDGIQDSKDKCPTEPGSKLLGGCPETIEPVINVPKVQLSEADQMVLTGVVAWWLLFVTAKKLFRSSRTRVCGWCCIPFAATLDLAIHHSAYAHVAVKFGLGM